MTRTNEQEEALRARLSGLRDAMVDDFEARGDHLKLVVVIAVGQQSNQLLESGCDCPVCLGQASASLTKHLQRHGIVSVQILDEGKAVH